jgi:thiamine kinase-like enzyme
MSDNTDARADLLIRDPSQISSQWLSTILGIPGLEVTGVQRIGTGQMSLTFRVSYTHSEGASTVIVKLASDNDTSRATGVGMGAYSREVAFYGRLSSRIGGPLPRCHLAEYDQEQGWFTLVLDDVTDGVQGDQIAGCSPDSAKRVMRALARLHAPVLDDAAVGAMDFLNLPNPVSGALMALLLTTFEERYGDQLADEYIEVCRRHVAALDAHAADRRPPLGLVHGDFRLDNLLFDETDCVVVDWQTVQWGPAMIDAAFFLGGSLSVEDRRAHEKSLIRTYHDGLRAAGASEFSWEDCWYEYRRQVFWGLTVVIGAAVMVERTARGDEMFTTMCRRVCQQILDLESLQLLPSAT